MLPELSYSLPAYRPGDYSRAAEWITDLKTLGFHCVTFTPTYLVHDEVPLRIDPERGPTFDELARAVGFALEAGCAVQIDPHLDWESTLTGGPYEWRRRMYFDPAEAYFDQLLGPIVGLLKAAGEERCTLTLGSELDVSLVEFSLGWLSVAEAIRKLAPGIALAHKLNGDSLDRGESIRTDLNRERSRRGFADIGRAEYVSLVRSMSDYLSALDVVSFSFYPSIEKTANMPVAFTDAAKSLAKKLRSAVGSHVQFAVGEFGLGSADTTRPWYFDEKTFLRPDGKMDDGARQTRRMFYNGFLNALSSGLENVERVSFWTVAQYDFLGVCGNDVFRDEELRSAVRDYNTEAI